MPHAVSSELNKAAEAKTNELVDFGAGSMSFAALSSTCLEPEISAEDWRHARNSHLVLLREPRSAGREQEASV